MVNDAAPARTELLEERDPEPLTPNVRLVGGVDCFGPAMGEPPSAYMRDYHSRATDVFIHPSFSDDGEGNF